MTDYEKLNLYRQEKMLEKLLKFRLRDHGFCWVKVECYNRFDGDRTMCRVEVFRGGKEIRHRLMKYEAFLGRSFVRDFEAHMYPLLE